MQDYIARSRSNPVFQDPDAFQNWFCPEALQLNTQIKKHLGGNHGISFFGITGPCQHMSKLRVKWGRGGWVRWEVQGIWVNHLLTKAFGKEH